ncbi:hypothetical protein [Staphylococcus phage phi879]|nr:hypothetical protein [Staphylococcus phage phi879]
MCLYLEEKQTYNHCNIIKTPSHKVTGLVLEVILRNTSTQKVLIYSNTTLLILKQIKTPYIMALCRG